MKKIIFVSLISALLLCGCNEKDTNSTADISAEQTFAETSAETETEIITETDTEITTAEITETIPENTVISSVAEETSSDDTQPIEIAAENIYLQNVPKIYSDSIQADNMQISYNSSEISEDCAVKIAGYLKSMEECNSEKYLPYLPPFYKEYLLEYLEESEYTVEELLKKNYDTTAEEKGGNFTYSAISVRKPTEADNVPDYVTDYKEQLDELSQEKQGINISESFTDCYTVICDADIAITETQQNEEISNMMLTVFEYEGSYYIIMA
ncbi:MAG: hypothetical protein ACI4JM_06240 [Oscillospiraceae bacterium]